MASKLFNMLSELSEDSAALARFKKNPESVMKKYGLTAKQKTLIKSALSDDKHHDLMKALGDEVHKHFHAKQNLFC